MTSIDKIEIYKELQRELQERKMQQSNLYFEEEFISVEYDPNNHWIYVDWKGYQTEGSVKAGGEKIFEAMVKHKCSSVLNDNTNVVGIWTPAAEWAGKEWFPRMEKAGLKKFAWIYSPSAMSRLSTNETLKHTPNVGIVRTFFTIDEARQWLSQAQ